MEKAVFSRAPQGICILDADGKVAQINKSLELLLGSISDEIIGNSPSVLFSDPGAFTELFRKLSESEQADMADVTLVNSDGELFIADVFLISLKNHKDKGYLLAINDMTRKMAEIEHALQKEKLLALGAMAGGVAHDFNNILMAILGNIQLMLARTKDEGALRRLQNIEKAVHDGSNTVRRLQRFTARDRGLEIPHAAVDVSEAIRDVLELTRPRWKDAMEKQGFKIEIQTDLEPCCLAKIHASDFREVLTNLIFNAIDAMPQGGLIAVRNRIHKGGVIIEVADTGIGMSEDVAKRIFDPYFTTKGVESSGLGLSVSWSIITRADGDLWVKSEPGKGSMFLIRLPEAGAKEDASYSPVMKEHSVSRRILLVDDNIEILGVIRDMLRMKGHIVVAEGHGADALKRLDEEEFDCVITDLGMPDVSGWDVARGAKSKRSDLPVILITGWAEQFAGGDLSRKGVDLLLSKPLSYEKLIDAVDGALEMSIEKAS